ncbi:hypothetical protein IJH15_00915 [Candidatus Saccharibacteria bacterium]|nr:hypothetical protein [Candidatus Saccharibacteria bacterium]MBQ6313455.1 hypothetical protein [Candidatus Saccharibacteria bacterium]
MDLKAETLARKEDDYRYTRKRVDIAYLNMAKTRAEIESAKEEMDNYREEKVRLEDEYQKYGRNTMIFATRLIQLS